MNRKLYSINPTLYTDSPPGFDEHHLLMHIALTHYAGRGVPSGLAYNC